jgi:hypothetical protein
LLLFGSPHKKSVVFCCKYAEN